MGRALGDPGLKPTVRVGEAALREVAAFLLDHDGFAKARRNSIPFTLHCNMQCPRGHDATPPQRSRTREEGQQSVSVSHSDSNLGDGKLVSITRNLITFICCCTGSTDGASYCDAPHLPCRCAGHAGGQTRCSVIDAHQPRRVGRRPQQRRLRGFQQRCGGRLAASCRRQRARRTASEVCVSAGAASREGAL